MSKVFLKADTDSVKVYSVKENNFNTSGFEVPFVTGTGSEAVQHTITTPDVSPFDFPLDGFCEKPAYCPELTPEEKKCTMYFPFGDKLEGYMLNDILYKDYIKAKGTWTVGDENEYFEIRNKRYRKKVFQESDAGTSLDNYYIKNEDIPLYRNPDVISHSYNNAFYGASSPYGEKINFTFDGVMPGTGQSSENLLIDSLSDPSMGFTDKSIYNTPAKVLERHNGSFDTFTITKTFDGTYTGDIVFSFCSKIYDTIFTGTSENVNQRSDLTAGIEVDISVNNGPVMGHTFYPKTEWSLFSTGKIEVENLSSIQISFKDVGIGDFEKVKISKLMLNKGDVAINYDSRYHFNTNPDYASKSFPIMVRFLRVNDSEEHYVPSQGSWTVCYKRFVNPTVVNQEKLDVFGNNYIQIGGRNGHPYFKVGDNEIELTEQVMSGHWEHIIVSYNAETKEVHYRNYNQGGVVVDSKLSVGSEENPFNVSLTIGDTGTHTFNLLLGSYIDNGTVKVNNYCKYSDLMIFPKVFTPEELVKLGKPVMALDFKCKSYYEKTTKVDNVDQTSYQLRNNLTVLRSPCLIETNRI